MPVASPSSLSTQQRAACDRVAAHLADEFDAPCALYHFAGGVWLRVADTSTVTAVSDDSPPASELDAQTIATLNDAADSDDGVAFPTTQGWRLALPQESVGAEASVAAEPLVAVLLFEHATRCCVERLAALYRKMRAEREQARETDLAVHSMAMQVSSNFEELMLLRDMAVHLQLEDGPADAEHAASKILPLLRSTLKAEHLALVHAASWSQRRVYWSGPPLMDADRCLELVDRFEINGRRPRIENHFSVEQWGEEFAAIRQLALVPVGESGVLLAINRIRSNDDARNDDLTSPGRFSTFEATLMTSVASLLATHFRNLDLLHQKHVLFTETVKSLINAVDARDPYTRGHSERVGLFSRRFAQHLGLSHVACERIYLAGLLHDVGKIGVSDATLQKPGKLTDDEYAELKRHPDQGWAILSDLQTMQNILPGVLYHHERFDGKGYPSGLAGEDIPLEGRLMAICDAYDAMTSDRPYRRGMQQDKAEAILLDGKGTQWDPRLVDAFMELMPSILEIRLNYSPRPLKSRRTESENA